MSKRRATFDPPEAMARGPAHFGSASAGPTAGGATQQQQRARDFSAQLKALNGQFAAWVQKQAASAAAQLWLDGVRDYASHTDKLLTEFADVLSEPPAGAIASPAIAGRLQFGTPVPATAAAAGGGGGSAGTGLLQQPQQASTGSGRKSVTFAATPTFGAPAAAAGGATPHPNTANAGHTPAPAGGLGFRFGTPGAGGGGGATPGSDAGSDAVPTPAFKLPAGGSTPGAGEGAGAAAATPGGFMFGVSPAAAPGASSGFGASGGFGASKPGATPSAAATGFTFGVTPATAGGEGGGGGGGGGGSSSSGAALASAAGGSGSGSGLWGAPPPSSSGASPSTAPAAGGFLFGMPTAAAAAGSQPASVPAFSFAAPSGTAAAAPSFGFGSAAAPAAAAAGAMFKFPPPASAAGGAAADGGGAAAAAAEGAAAAAADGDVDADGGGNGSAKFMPELKVDEAVWRVFFSSKARLHVRVKKDGGAMDWEPRGLGSLTVRQPKEGPGSDRAYVVFSTDGGKQLVASPLMAGSQVMPFPNCPKKCRMSLMALTYELPPAGAAPGDAAAAAAPAQPKHTLQVCMLSFGNPDKVQELSAAVEEHKPPPAAADQ